ncbi:MAG: ATP-dependent chaperone ClpB, partial [Actinobacteria bacterium]|nr:ATP-dependent chaperone ClpB [Actinomycetota bacterium]
MRLDKLAVTSQEAVVVALGIASEYEAAAAEPEHLLKALLESKEHNLSSIIERIGADPAAIEKIITEKLVAAPKVAGATIQAVPSNRFVTVLDNAVKAAEKMGDSFATTEHLLIALADDKGDA